MNETAEQYDASSFKRLDLREFMRQRPGMYVGDCHTFGMHHLAGELINNSIDELLLGQATRLTVTIHQDESLSVEDDGRGISVSSHTEASAKQGRVVSTLEVVMTEVLPHRVHKRCINGLGLKTVNFLSQSCVATVWRDGYEYQLQFAKGELVGELQRLGQTTKHGTRITFQVDPEIFAGNPKFDYDRLRERLRELAYLHPSFAASIHDERTMEFRFERGISQLVEDLSIGRENKLWYRRSPLHADVLRLETEGNGVQVEIALLFTDAMHEVIHTYVNDDLVPDGGTPTIGLRRGVTRAIQNYARKHQLSGEVLPTGDDLRRGLTAVIAAKVAEPQFAGATRHKIANPELVPLMESAVYQQLQQYFAAHPETATRIWEQGVVATQMRIKEEQYMSC